MTPFATPSEASAPEAMSALLLKDRASLAVLLESKFAFGEAPLENVDAGFPTAARPGWAYTAAAYQEQDAADEQEPEQWPGHDLPAARKSQQGRRNFRENHPRV